jgi:hypothetical protein
VSAVDLVRQLDKQLRYIDTSAGGYDAGEKDEAIRIGTSLRVIFHQTQASTSLLRHLGGTYTRIMTSLTKPPYPQDWFSPLAVVCGTVHIPEHHRKDCPHHQPPTFIGPTYYRPFLDGVRLARQVQAPDWWGNEPAMILHHRKTTRKDVVLWAANKDGGAHVDEKLPIDYVHLSNCIKIGISNDPTDEAKFQTAKDAHLAMLRQMAHEVLKSPDLLKLSGR